MSAMVTYDAETTRAIRVTTGGIFTILSGYLFAGSTLASFTLNEADLPGYPLFWLSTLGLLVSSVALGMGKTAGIRGLQAFAITAFLGLLLSKVRHDVLAILVDAFLLGGAAFVAEIVGRLVRSRASRDRLSVL